METNWHVEQINKNLDWIEELISDIKKYRDDERPEWILRMAIRLNSYCSNLAENADDWKFDIDHQMKIKEGF